MRRGHNSLSQMRPRRICSKHFLDSVIPTGTKPNGVIKAL